MNLSYIWPVASSIILDTSPPSSPTLSYHHSFYCQEPTYQDGKKVHATTFMPEIGTMPSVVSTQSVITSISSDIKPKTEERLHCCRDKHATSGSHVRLRQISPPSSFSIKGLSALIVSSTDGDVSNDSHTQTDVKHKCNYSTLIHENNDENAETTDMTIAKDEIKSIKDDGMYESVDLRENLKKVPANGQKDYEGPLTKQDKILDADYSCSARERSAFSENKYISPEKGNQILLTDVADETKFKTELKYSLKTEERLSELSETISSNETRTSSPKAEHSNEAMDDEKPTFVARPFLERKRKLLLHEKHRSDRAGSAPPASNLPKHRNKASTRGSTLLSGNTHRELETSMETSSSTGNDQ